MTPETIKPIPKHYTEIIRDIFNERTLKNDSYSLRAFARDLDLMPGHLSEILALKTNLSLKKALETSALLKLSGENQKLFLKLVEMANANDARKSSLELQLYNFDSSHLVISNDLYSRISEWHSLALLELISLKDFKHDLVWIAERLSITTDEAAYTIKNLLQSQLIQLEDGELKKQYDYFVLPNGNKSNSAKDFHKLVLNKATTAIDEQLSETRNFTAAFIHINKDDIAEISERIKIFRRELAKEFETENNSDSIYMLSAQLFRVDLPNTSSELSMKR